MERRLIHLEEMDKQDREDGTTRMQRLRQISRETGKFLTIMALGAPEGNWIELGTSAGYSSVWIGLAAKEKDRMLTTFEILPKKIELAKETFRLTELDDVISLVEGDAITHLQSQRNLAFCFLDLEKGFYQQCYDLIIPKLVSGGLLLVDNVISHKTELEKFCQRALSDERVDACILSQGKGLLLVRKI